MIIFALFASIYAVILDVNVQSMLARTVAGMLSNKLETEVKIRTFYVNPDLRIHAEEVQINDKKHLPMFYVGSLNAKLSFRDMTKELRVKNMTIDDILVNIVKYEDEYETNLAELFPLSNEKKKKDTDSNMKIFLDKLDLSRGHIVVWNQNKDKPESLGIDYSHLDVDSISLSMNDLSYSGDTISGIINHLSASEKSGFTIDEFISNSSFIVSSHCLDFKNLNVETHATDLDLDLKFLYNGYGSYKKFVDSIMIIANIRPSQLTLSDLKYFSPVMGKMTDTLQINGLVTGFVRDFTANNFKFSFKDSTNFEGTIKMKGLPKFHETHIVGDVKKMNFTYQDISEFAIPTHDCKIPLPENLASLKEGFITGEFYGFHNNFNAKFNLHTNLGNIFFDGALNNDLLIVPNPYYFFTMHANNFNVKDVCNLNEDFMVTIMADLKGEGFSKDDADVELSLDVEKLKFMDNELNDFSILCKMKDAQISALTNINSENLKADLNALVDVSDTKPAFDVKLNIADANLYELNLFDKDENMHLSTNLNAKLKGINIDQLYGTLTLDSTSLCDSRGVYDMDKLTLTLSENYFDSKDVKLVCDFFDLDINGIFNFRNIDNSFKNYFLNHFHINKWTDRGVKLKDEVQEFYVQLDFKDTETLSRLLFPGLKISDNTAFTATFTSDDYSLNSTLESDNITYNGMKFNDLYVINRTEQDKTTGSVKLKELILKDATEKNPVTFGLDNFALNMDAHNDSLLLSVLWDDDIPEDKNKGLISAIFLHNHKGGHLHINSSDVIINDTLWNLSENCNIYFNSNKINFDEFDISSKSQSVKLRGALPMTANDTLFLNFDKLNISDFDMLTSELGLDIDGIINGQLRLSGIKDKFTFFSNLDVDDLYLNKHMLGNAFIDANWNAPDTSIFIDTEIIRDDTQERLLTFVGKYYTSRINDNIDFSIDMRGLDISLVNSFTENVISRVEGSLDGYLFLDGSLKKPILSGDVLLNDAACKIDYLNTYYKVNPKRSSKKNEHYIRLSENKIEFDDIILVDTLNNMAVAEGVITHNYLKNFNFNIDVALDNFLAMNMPQDGNASFYGTAVASGDLKINGPLDDIVMDINASSMPGTIIDVVLNSVSSINDNFIVFVQKDNAQDSVSTIVPEKKKNKKFTLNLNADVTQDAIVNIHLPSNMGNIEASGSGNIRLGLDSDKLYLYGDYVINDGTFVFNFQNLVRRDFDIKQGGTITWTGKVDDADINVAASYRTKSSISSLGLEMDSTSLVNNINVDCIVHLQEKLTNPTITFGLSLPNVTDDIRNAVFSVIDTTNQAVMSQQIISLLVLGSFSYSNANLYSIGASNYYNVLTSSLSSWLSQISKDFDIGVKYTPEDNITAEELEVALSTQLFNDRLTIEGNLGMYTGNSNEVAGGANSIVGDVDVSYKITNRLSLKIYNHSNLNSNYYLYTYEAYSDYTQGVGISYSQSFDNIKEIFARNKKKKNNRRSK